MIPLQHASVTVLKLNGDYAADKPQLERNGHYLGAELVAPTCWSQPLDGRHAGDRRDRELVRAVTLRSDGGEGERR